ncbi:nuclear transport factor 2 family protein [Streptococcus pneumoniae]
MNKKAIVLTMVTVSGLFLQACSNATNENANKQEQVATSQEAKKMSNIDKAISVIKSFETGDKTAITEYVNEKNYIQHNLSVPDGRDVVLNSIGQLADAGTKVEVVRSFEDENFVVLHSKYQIAGGAEQAGFDIFRFDDGKIVEHWDNLQNLGEKNPSGHTLLDGDTKVQDTDKTDENKTLVRNFVTDILVNKDLDKASNYFDGDDYIQHNPQTGDGVKTTIEGFKALKDSGFDMNYSEIKMVLGQGNFVLVASQGTLMGEDAAYYDLFRVENGKIKEHWDIVTAIPKKDTWANQNGKF